MYNEVRLGDIGTNFDVNVKEMVCGETQVADPTTATTRQITFAKPSGATIIRTAIVTTDCVSDPILRYVTVSGDLDEVGRWSLQAYLVFPSWSGRSTIKQFTVHENL